MPVKEEGKAGRLGTTHDCSAALREPWPSQKEALVQKHLQSPWQCPSPSTVLYTQKCGLSSNPVVGPRGTADGSCWLLHSLQFNSMFFPGNLAAFLCLNSGLIR